MKKILKTGTIVDSKNAMTALNACPLPVTISLKLSRFMLKIQEHLKGYENVRSKHIIELGEEDPTGSKQYIVKPTNPNFTEYLSRLEKIRDEETEFEVPEIKGKELESHTDVNGKPIKMTTGDLMLLDWLIIE